MTTINSFFKEFAQQKKWKTILVLSSLKTDDDIFFECFVASAYSGPFQTLFSRPISCQLVTFLYYVKDRLVSQARPFLFPWQCQSHIGYEYWKQLVLWNRKGLLVRPSQQFVSISKSRCSPLRTSMN